MHHDGLELAEYDLTSSRIDALGGTALQLTRRNPTGSSDESPRLVWLRLVTDERKARCVFRWARGKPERHRFWGLLAEGVGMDAVNDCIDREFAVDAEARDKERAERKRKLNEKRAKAKRDAEITLWRLDPDGKKPGLQLEKGSDKSWFFKMEFLQRWERDRVMDWLGQQKDRYAEWREFCLENGSKALERIVLEGILVTEREVKTAGLSAGGRRPLRFWRR